jgi:hypothetical protein
MIKLLNYRMKSLESVKELKCIQGMVLLDGGTFCACFDGSVRFGIFELEYVILQFKYVV